MNRVRKKSPKTYRMESTGPKVLSRYLSGPIGSCHDYCKCATMKQTTETKPTKHTNPFSKRATKAPAEKTIVDAAHSVPRIKKAPSVVPKATTRPIKNNKVVKDETLNRDISKFPTKKYVAVEPKSRDLKPKSQNSKTKTSYMPSSRTLRRRHSETFLPNKDMFLPLRVPKRRLSCEIVLHPNKNVGSASNVSLVQGPNIRKNASRKDPKLSSANKKSNHLKTTVSSSRTVAKLPTLRSYRSLPKLELKGSRKSKPAKTIAEVVREKTPHVLEPNNVVETTKNQIPISSAAASSSEEKVMICDHQGLQECSPSMEDHDTPATNDQYNDNVTDLEDENTKEARRGTGKLVVETRDHFPAELIFRQGKVLSTQSECNSPRKLLFRQGKELDVNQIKKAENKILRRLSSDGAIRVHESLSINVDLKHQEMEEKKDSPRLSNLLIEETARKLIEARKSKVKALVGAFENITSLTP